MSLLRCYLLLTTTIVAAQQNNSRIQEKRENMGVIPHPAEKYQFKRLQGYFCEMIDIFHCTPTECVLSGWVCDGESDCSNGKDEEGCIKQCENNEWLCPSQDKCIDNSYMCDGEIDCSDRSDEENCGTVACKWSQMGVEYRGTKATTASGRTCQRWDSQYPHEHSRNNVNQYPDAKFNQANYCRNPDHESGGPWCYTTDPDERWEYCGIPFCQECHTTQFFCVHDNICIAQLWVCDDEYDCVDGSDELNCETGIIISAPPSNNHENFTCSDGSVIRGSWVCDGVLDCPDEADENSCS